jgi:hypothetical protein
MFSAFQIDGFTVERLLFKVRISGGIRGLIPKQIILIRAFLRVIANLPVVTWALIALFLLC